MSRSFPGCCRRSPIAGARSSAIAAPRRSASSGLLGLAQKLLTGRGEASGMALAAAILAGYGALTPAQRLEFLTGAATRFGPDLDALGDAASAFLANPDESEAAKLMKRAEPRRQELLRRLNHAPGGTLALVRMREDMIGAWRKARRSTALDADFVHLFTSWFNRGFLVLRRIDWTTPANILEKIIRYEAVHAIEGWDDLRRRLEPADRRLYAFFHPALGDEPLIFVEVALTDAIPAAIAPLLAPDRAELAPKAATTAVFYSISNAQRGLARVSFGNFLIKQVVEELKREWPRLSQFRDAVAGAGLRRLAARARRRMKIRRRFRRRRGARWRCWKSRIGRPRRRRAKRCSARSFRSPRIISCMRAPLPAASSIPSRAFTSAMARGLERLNPFGDLSETALRQSHGLMVNYLYDLDHIEENHEAYANKNEVVASSAVRKLARAKPREISDDGA